MSRLFAWVRLAAGWWLMSDAVEELLSEPPVGPLVGSDGGGGLWRHWRIPRGSPLGRALWEELERQAAARRPN